MADLQDFTDDELLTVYKNPKSDLSKLTPGELQRLDRLTMPAVDRATMRAQGDAAAAREQQRLTNQPVFSMANAGKDLTSAGSGLFGVLKTLGTAALTNPLGLNQPNIRYDPAAHENAPSFGDQAASALGTLRTLPGRAWNALTTDPRETALEAGVTPKAAAEGIGAATGAGLLATIAGKTGVISPSGVKAAATRFAQDVPIVKGVKPAMDAYRAAANPVSTFAEQMGLSPTATGATLESLPNTAVPQAARAPIPVEPAATAAARTDAATAAQAARAAQSAELGVSPQSAGATLESLPNTPAPAGGRTAMTPNQDVQAASAAADAAARRAELMQQLGVGEKPPLLAEAPEPTAVSGEAREPIPVPVKSEPQPIPPAARSNTVLPAKDLGQILREVQQQLAEEPVTTASGSPPQTVTAGGKPAVTQAEYDALQARIPENAARSTDPLPAIDQPKPEPTAAPPAATVYHGSAEMGRRGGYPGELRLDVSPIGQTRQPGSNADSMGTWWTTSQADAAHYGQSLGPNGELIPGTVIEGQVSHQNPRVFNSAEEWQKFANSFRKGGQPANGDAIRAQLEGEGHDGLVIKGGGVGDATPDGGDFHLSFNNRNVSVATPAAKAGPAPAEPQPTLPWDEPVAPSGESVTPARSEKSAAELARDAIGARDQAAALRRQGIPATTESVRAETRARTTGGTGETSVISLNATNRIAGKMKDMLDSGASDKELLDYVNKARPADRKQIGLMLNGLLVGMGRQGIPILGAAGAAAVGGGALRSALVNQLQGDQKEQD